MKSRKTILGTLGVITAIATPIVTAVSCGSSASELQQTTLYKKLVLVKIQSITEYQNAVIEQLKDSFKDQDGLKFTSKDLNKISQAKEKAISDNKKTFDDEIKAANKDKDKETKAKEKYNKLVADAIKKAAESLNPYSTKKEEPILADAETVKVAIDRQETIQAVKDIFRNYKSDAKGTKPVDIQSIDDAVSKNTSKTQEEQLEVAKQAAKKLVTNKLFNDFKPAKKAIIQDSIITLSDYKTKLKSLLDSDELLNGSKLQGSKEFQEAKNKFNKAKTAQESLKEAKEQVRIALSLKD
ncbi:MAG: hypothetical protein GY679_04575 [Mycoplasma sp.]|nr:hypothetical protein [Mycoplasma sp.]